MSVRIKCNYCDLTFNNNYSKTYHTKLHHPEMKRSYNKHSSNSSVYSASSLNSSRPPAPLLLLEDAVPSNIIVGKKRPSYNDDQDDFSILDVDDSSVRVKVENLLEKATQLFAEGKTAEEVAKHLGKRLSREEAIQLRAELDRLGLG